MKADDSDYRSLTPKPGWLQKICERCEGDFWLAPGQFSNIRYCKDECRHEPPEIRFWKSVTKDGPMHPTEPSLGQCWNSKFTPSAPYPTLKVHGVQIRAARFSLELFLGRRLADGLYALHSCDNTRCVNPEHLREGTEQDNHDDRVKRNRSARNQGEKCPTSKLKEEQASDIKFNPQGLTGKQLAAKHNISEPQVSAIRRGRQWAHLKKD